MLDKFINILPNNKPLITNSFNNTRYNNNIKLFPRLISFQNNLNNFLTNRK